MSAERATNRNYPLEISGRSGGTSDKKKISSKSPILSLNKNPSTKCQSSCWGLLDQIKITVHLSRGTSENRGSAKAASQKFGLRSTSRQETGTPLRKWMLSTPIRPTSQKSLLAPFSLKMVPPNENSRAIRGSMAC